MLLWLLVFLVVLPGGLRAHQVDTVEFEFQQWDGKWRLLGEMDIAYMLPETRKVPGGEPLSRAAVMKAPPEELARIRRETENTLRSLLRISFGGQDVKWRIEFPDFEKEPFALPDEDADWALLNVRVVVDAKPGPGDLMVHWSGEEESELIILTEDSENGEIVSVPPGGEMTLLHVEASGDVKAAEQSALSGWILDGYRHVLPKGMDHMLFILGLFLMAPRWKPLMVQSLLFTLAHSVTLGLAVFGLVHINGRLVEILIAFSIAFIGVENLLSRKVGKLRYGLVVAFGLVHGLGFASILAGKLEGVPRDQLALPLFGFNVGVEIAQITVLIAAFLVLWPLKKWTIQVQTVGSVFVALAGVRMDARADVSSRLSGGGIDDFLQRPPGGEYGEVVISNLFRRWPEVAG